MKSRMLQILVLLSSCMFLGSQALAWDCPSGQIRQQAPAGTPTSTPYYDVVEGIAFICVPSTPTTTGTGSNTNNNTNTNGNTNNNSNSNSNTNNNTSSSTSTATSNVKVSNKNYQQQSQNQNQTQTATGGTATSSATGGNASVGNTSSTSAATGNGVGNGNGSNNTTTNVEAAKIPVNTAYAPTAVPTAPCQKGFGGGAQTGLFGGSFGGSKTDKVCEGLEIARSFAISGARLAYCKQMIATAHLADKNSTITLDDCLYVPAAIQTASQPVAVIAPSPVVVPAPVVSVTVLPAPVMVSAPMTQPAPVVAKKRVIHHQKPDCQNQLVMECVTKPKGEK